MLRRHKILLEILEAGRPCSSANAPSMDGRTSRTSPPPAPRSRPSAHAPTHSSGAMADGQLAAPRPARGGQDYPAKPCTRKVQTTPSRSKANRPCPSASYRAWAVSLLAHMCTLGARWPTAASLARGFASAAFGHRSPSLASENPTV